MKHQRRRSQKREEKRQKKKEAAALRAEHGLCLHGDEERSYATDAEADADDAPAKVCDECGKPKLVVKVTCPVFSQTEMEGVPIEALKAEMTKNILK